MLEMNDNRDLPVLYMISITGEILAEKHVILKHWGFEVTIILVLEYTAEWSFLDGVGKLTRICWSTFNISLAVTGPGLLVKIIALVELSFTDVELFLNYVGEQDGDQSWRSWEKHPMVDRIWHKCIIISNRRLSMHLQELIERSSHLATLCPIDRSSLLSIW